MPRKVESPLITILPPLEGLSFHISRKHQSSYTVSVRYPDGLWSHIPATSEEEVTHICNSFTVATPAYKKSLL